MVLTVQLLPVTMRQGLPMSFRQEVLHGLLLVYPSIIFSGVAVSLHSQRLIWLKWLMISSFSLR